MKRLDRAISRLFGARRESDFTLIVRWAYAYYLKREPDEAGLEGYVAQLRKGMTVGQLAAALADSDEARELAKSRARLEAEQELHGIEQRQAAAELRGRRSELDQSGQSLRAAVQLLAAPPPATASALKVSVIMPVWNRAQKVRGAIESVLSQTGVDLELVVADDGSEDATWQVLQSYDADPRIRLIRLRRSGSGAARNAALAAATGDIVAYLDSDNSYFPAYLARLAAAYAETGAMCGYAAMLWDDGKLPRLRHDHFDWGRLRANQINIDMNCFSHRRELVGELGGFDESLARHADYDLALRYTRAYAPHRFSILSAYYDDRHDPSRLTMAALSGPAMASIWAKHSVGLGRPLRVLIVSDSYPQLSENYIDTEVAWLTARGVEVHVMSLRDPGAPGRAAAPVHRGSAAAVIDEVLPDVVHVHWLHTIAAVAEAVTERGLPVTIRGHSFDFSDTAWRSVAELPCVRRIYLFPHFVDRLPEAMKEKAAKLPACFNSRRIRPGSVKDRRLVLRAGASLDSKDLETFFAAARRLPDYRFVLVLARIAHLPGVADKFIDLNRRLGNPVEMHFNLQYEAMAELYARAGIYLHTTDLAYPFGMPVSIIEAMASGAAIIMRRTPDAAIYASPGVLSYDDADGAVACVSEAGEWPEHEWRQRTNANIERAFGSFADDRVLPQMLSDWVAMSEGAPASDTAEAALAAPNADHA